jgi:D-glycero-D-manno-heptose 1,7-bisphosphate phosphatase
MLQRAAFLDRDGVINFDHGYVHKIEDFTFIPGVFEAIQLLEHAGYLVIVITNQSGIARGYFTDREFERLCTWMEEQLRAKNINLTAVYHCPHLKDASVEKYRHDCQCRKPMPGMIKTACLDWAIDASKSVLFGDKDSDIQAGMAAGVGKNIKVARDSAVEGLLAAVKEFIAASGVAPI